MKNSWIYLLGSLGALLLVGIEIASIYYIMPFPGSQRQHSVELAYFIVNYINYFRFAGLLLLIYPVYHLLKGSIVQKVMVATVTLVYLIIAYKVNYKMQADAMFLQLKDKRLLATDKNKVDRKKLVIGLTWKGEHRAYPIEIIGYHHQVVDTVAGDPMMVTYCTVCRTGRIYRPIVNGELEDFRLVGMDHFNAMFEDSRTKSWWRQANGEAIVGPLKGTFLEEVTSQQMSLLSWIDQHPNTLILQPDTFFTQSYDELAKFDEGTIDSGLEKRDSLSWQEKSWVVGIQQGTDSKAYDWNDLVRLRTINDFVNEVPVLLTLEPDSVSFHAWNRDTLDFSLSDGLRDRQTSSTWNWQGQCTEGKLKGAQLKFVQAYQEFWHSWKTFHPGTIQYIPKEN
jgi:Ca2+/Na+ antiporter